MIFYTQNPWMSLVNILTFVFTAIFSALSLCILTNNDGSLQISADGILSGNCVTANFIFCVLAVVFYFFVCVALVRQYLYTPQKKQNKKNNHQNKIFYAKAFLWICIFEAIASAVLNILLLKNFTSLGLTIAPQGQLVKGEYAMATLVTSIWSLLFGISPVFVLFCIIHGASYD